MGKLAIRRVIYNGKKYYFESPPLNDGIVVIEGVNGHGKSTFMSLIYNKYDDNTDRKHNEIYYDEDNYVELEIQIDDKTYELTRSIGDNSIFVVDSDKKVFETCVYRSASNQDTIVFSDWILGELGIDVFDIIQGTKSFKLNFSDLMRLIYHDQTTEVDKIYKVPDNSNFISDSLEIRKAIFEVLLGEIYNDYYSALGEYKLKVKEFEKTEAIMDSYDEFLGEVLSEDLANVNHIKSVITENEEMINKAIIESDIARNEKNNSTEIFRAIDEQKAILDQVQSENNSLLQAKSATNQSIEKILFLMEEAEKELREIEKIRFVNKKLRLFTPNTCPYCLREVERKKGTCICSCDIDEEQYEKFFYTDHEYLEILKVKKKAFQSLNSLLDKKNDRMKTISLAIIATEKKASTIRQYIQDLSKDITSDYNSAFIRQLDNRIGELKAQNIELRQAQELAQKRENIVVALNRLRNQVDALKIKVDSHLSSAQKDMLTKNESFSEIYFELMKEADEFCYTAYIGDDYMPHINRGIYRERSALVPKRLMFFLTMLIISLQKTVNFPKFLLIDTPNKEGIDKENLIKNISLLSKANKVETKPNSSFQMILTTGLGAYPESFKEYVVLTLEGDNFLLKEKGKIATP
mgnify:CR=1 FL=1